MRPINCLLAMTGVWVGAYLTWFKPLFYAPGITGIAAFLACGAGNAVNDCVDIDIDRINRPDRVLVKGTLSRRYALILAAVLNLVAVGLALTVSREVTVVGLVTIALLYMYNFRLKSIPVLGNLAVSFLAGLTFVTGGVAVDFYFAFDLPGPLIAFIFAFLFHLVREIVKDVQDIEGDRAVGISTLPQVIGVQKSLLIVLALFFVLVLLSFMPLLYGWYGTPYKIVAIYVMELPILSFLIFLWGNPTPVMLKVASGVLKAGMALGIVALLLA
ncbi:MAG: geranylgeranylglycerol-phosphate geranylgeranyltransferase [Candidatus Zixiibacteriota bacterium]|nr:MAG: geranylgeranylglycerol-phosphate geranylgeranyltransferase [candidate division Zixibacteria bacterium]